MAGRRLPILPKRLLDFSNIAVSGSGQTIVIADRIELLDWRELTLVLRVHSHNVASTNTIEIHLQNTSRSDEDPSLDFIGSQIASFPLITSSTPIPSLFEIAVPTTGMDCVADLARINARGTRNAAATISALVTLEFSTKDA